MVSSQPTKRRSWSRGFILRNLSWTLSSQGHSGAKSLPVKMANLTLVISPKATKKEKLAVKNGGATQWVKCEFFTLVGLGGTWKIIRRKRKPWKPFCKSNSQFGSCAFAILFVPLNLRIYWKIPVLQVGGSISCSPHIYIYSNSLIKQSNSKTSQT